VRWGKLRQNTGWPLFLPATVFGLCVWPEKLILVDEAQQRGRTVAQFVETILHELIHTRQTPRADAAQFEEALKRAKAYYFGPTTGPAPRASASQKRGQDGVRDAEDVRRPAGAENRGAARP
jgi:hypothetical protein